MNDSPKRVGSRAVSAITFLVWCRQLAVSGSARYDRPSAPFGYSDYSMAPVVLLVVAIAVQHSPAGSLDAPRQTAETACGGHVTVAEAVSPFLEQSGLFERPIG